MTSLKTTPTLSAICLLVYVFGVQFADTLYLANEMAPPPGFEILSPLGFLWLICWWLESDSRRVGTKWPMDLGMFLYVAWIFIVPYHLFKTRGLRAFIGILS